jgi:hypothetical protein
MYWLQDEGGWKYDVAFSFQGMSMHSTLTSSSISIRPANKAPKPVLGIPGPDA